MIEMYKTSTNKWRSCMRTCQGEEQKQHCEVDANRCYFMAIELGLDAYDYGF